MNAWNGIAGLASPRRMKLSASTRSHGKPAAPSWPRCGSTRGGPGLRLILSASRATLEPAMRPRSALGAGLWSGCQWAGRAGPQPKPHRDGHSGSGCHLGHWCPGRVCLSLSAGVHDHHDQGQATRTRTLGSQQNEGAQMSSELEGDSDVGARGYGGEFRDTD
jgi:hypothetical protein